MTVNQELADFMTKLPSIFGLQEHGSYLVKLITTVIGCKYVCLLFLNIEKEGFSTLVCTPKSRTNPLSHLQLSHQNSFVRYLRQEKELLTRARLVSLPDFRFLRHEGSGSANHGKIELVVPLISRERLFGILLLGEKPSGEYLPEDYGFLDEAANVAAASMEKEYLRERLARQKEELMAINRSSAIIASSLDIQRVFDSFIEGLRRIADIDWAGIILITDSNIRLLALSSRISSAWKLNNSMPIAGTATEWVANHKKAIIEPDLKKRKLFSTTEGHIQQGVRSSACLPLIADDRVIGSLIIASRRPAAYHRRQLMLLENLTPQITMSVENSKLYAQVEEEARIDALTGLLNRRALDETLIGEISRHSRYGGVFSLIILDLDSLKTINDSYGHLAGDQALRQISSVIKRVIRASDQAYRYGGDEFAVLLPHTPLEAAAIVAERVKNQIAKQKLPGQSTVTASLGLAGWPAHGNEANAIIAAADAALYQAKQKGGNLSCSAPDHK